MVLGRRRRDGLVRQHDRHPSPPQVIEGVLGCCKQPREVGVNIDGARPARDAKRRRVHTDGHHVCLGAGIAEPAKAVEKVLGRRHRGRVAEDIYVI